MNWTVEGGENERQRLGTGWTMAGNRDEDMEQQRQMYQLQISEVKVAEEFDLENLQSGHKSRDMQV